MSELEIARLTAEIIGITATVAGGLWWLSRLLWQAIEKLDGVNSRLDTMNGNVRHLTQFEQQQRELNAWFAGKIGEELPKRRDQ